MISTLLNIAYLMPPVIRAFLYAPAPTDGLAGGAGSIAAAGGAAGMRPGRRPARGTTAVRGTAVPDGAGRCRPVLLCADTGRIPVGHVHDPDADCHAVRDGTDMDLGKLLEALVNAASCCGGSCMWCWRAWWSPIS
jgi:hypothetical protein